MTPDHKPAGFDLLEDVIPCATLSQISEALFNLERTLIADTDCPAPVFWEVKKIRFMLEPHVCSGSSNDCTPEAHDTGGRCTEHTCGLTGEQPEA